MTEEQESTLKGLRAERTQLRRTFTKAVKLIEERFKKKDVTPKDIEGDFQLVADKADRLFKLDEQVSRIFYQVEEDEENLDREADSIETYRDTWLSVCHMRTTLSDQQATTSTSKVRDDESCSTSSGSRIKRNFHLPKLKLNKFDGSLKNWIGFWAQFRKIDEDDTLEPDDKFQYLIQCMEPGSPAHELVVSFPPSGENYPLAITQLKKRFGRDALLIELYVRELLALVLEQTVKQHKITLCSLYDKLVTQLRALQTLGVTSDKYASMLLPLVESALPVAVMKEWERRRLFFSDEERKGARQTEKNDSSDIDDAAALDQLLVFLQREVECEEKVRLAQKTFCIENTEKDKQQELTKKKKNMYDFKKDVSQVKGGRVGTATDFLNVKLPNKVVCVFCDGTHLSGNCFKARELSIKELEEKLSLKGCCFLCFKPKHTKKFCKAAIKCIICDARHSPLLCTERVQRTKKDESPSQVEQNLFNSDHSRILMQTLMVKVKGPAGETNARLLFDSGSQRSYITKRIAALMSYESLQTENLIHLLFGGTETESKTHQCYKLQLGNIQNNYCCNFDVLDTDEICRSLPTATRGCWVSELRQKGIVLTDAQDCPIDILVGADIGGKLFTGRKEVLSCGLVAIETLLGWTVMGRVRDKSSDYMVNVSMLNTNISLPDMWRLDLIGIEDPTMMKSKMDVAAIAQENFTKTVKILDDGRYEVQLPWLEDHQPLQRNFEIAKGRLETSMKKLKSTGQEENYEGVLLDWLGEGIIEELPAEEWDKGHYLPHRPVFKQNSTTPIRPVFDASAHGKGEPSINQCLAKGPNLIDLIPNILIRFRLHCIGVIADIQKAFLQISLCESDRDFLRFLWNSKGLLKIYRHARVVFGVNSSPFLLNAVIEHHLVHCFEKINDDRLPFSVSTIKRLQGSWYVDNVVSSIESSEKLKMFISESTDIMKLACFNLRGWEYSDSSLTAPTEAPVLGILWERKNDSLKIKIPVFDIERYIDVVSKRDILSAFQRIFDPIGLAAPTTLIPKLLMQRAWVSGINWDSDVDEAIRREFMQWVREVHLLNNLEIPRWINYLGNKLSLHVFCDASQHAYAAICFLRVDWEGEIKIHLIEAKSRVAPLKRTTIPRLELLAATIGTRLSHSIMRELKGTNCHYWSDSTTVIAWIKRDQPWGTFVINRVKEIRILSDTKFWRHVPGSLNPADLLSRGCSPSQLITSKWWEGPSWLRLPPNEWPTGQDVVNEEEINVEIKKSTIAIINSDAQRISDSFLQYFSNYNKLVRHIGWMLRFFNNTRKGVRIGKSQETRDSGNLTVP